MQEFSKGFSVTTSPEIGSGGWTHILHWEVSLSLRQRGMSGWVYVWEDEGLGKWVSESANHRGVPQSEWPKTAQTRVPFNTNATAVGATFEAPKGI